MSAWMLPSTLLFASLIATDAAVGGATPSSGGTCPGSIMMAGKGPVALVNAKWNIKDDPAGVVAAVDNRTVAPYMKGRTYFAESCTDGKYDHNNYMALNLLGKTMQFTVDLAGAGCGCNAAFYLTSLRQNDQVSECQDYYCDANNVCGESCAEIDIMEANQRAWHSTLHTRTDTGGVGAGYGGGAGWDGPRDFSSQQYGPGASCIDTEKPFIVEVSFPVGGTGTLEAMEVKLSQEGSGCPLSLRLGDYNGMSELSDALAAGMTPIVSYWSADDMLWMDGTGADGNGPCSSDDASACGASIKMSDFSVRTIGANVPTVPPRKIDDSEVDAGSAEATTTEISDAGDETTRGTEGESSDQSPEGFCCLQALFSNDPCGSCAPHARIEEESWCARSEGNCLACAKTALWCDLGSIDVGRIYMRKDDAQMGHLSGLAGGVLETQTQSATRMAAILALVAAAGFSAALAVVARARWLATFPTAAVAESDAQWLIA